MLQSIREHTSGWVAGFVIALLIIPFAFWGIGDYFGITATNYVAKVNGKEISVSQFQRQYQNVYQRQVQQFRQFLGEQFSPEMIDQEKLRKSVLDDMIERALVEQHIEELGYAVSDQQLLEVIHGYPQFQRNGEFSVELYKSQLARNGLSPALFESGMRRQIKLGQFADAVQGSAFVTDEMLARVIALRNQQREIGWAVVPAERFVDEVQPDEEQIAAFYEKNKERFLTEERVTLRYLELDGSELAADVEVDEATLRGLYAERVKNISQQAERKARHILLAVEGDSEADWKAAEKKARELREKILAGADFAELARKHSEDPGSAEASGELGWVSTGMMVQPFEDALFALKEEGAVSEPVRTTYGVHLIQLEEIRAPEVADFAQLRDELASQYRQEQIADAYYEKAQKLTDLAYANPDTLEPAAEALGLEIGTLESVSRQEQKGILANPAVREAAFSQDLIESGRNSDPIELGDNRAVVIRVTGHQPAEPRPLAEVREEIVKQLKRELAAEKAAQLTERMLEQARGEGTLAAQAEELGLAWQEPRLVGRNAGDVPAALVRAAFEAAAPTAEDATLGRASLGNGDEAVFRLSRVVPGEVAGLSQEEKQSQREALARREGAAQLAAYVQQLRADADIVIKQDNLTAE